MNESAMSGLAEYRARVDAGEIDAPTVGDQWTRFAYRNTRKTAIDAMCVRCMGWDRDGERPPGVRAMVQGCTDSGCPLHEWRPYRRAAATTSAAETTTGDN